MIFNKLFAKYLVEESFIDLTIANNYCEIADKLRIPIYKKLVDDNIIEEEKIYQVLAKYLGYEYRLYQLFEINLDFVKNYPRDLLMEYQTLPIELKDDILTVVGANPFRIEELGEFLSCGGQKIKFVICPPSQMKRILDYANNKIQQNDVMSEYINNDSFTEDLDFDLKIDAPIINLL